MNTGYKVIYLFLLLFSQITSSAQGTWERINVPTTKFLRSVVFTDSLYGWAAGDSGTIIHTTDGGKSWTSQNSLITNEIGYISFLNRNLGWASSFNYTTIPYGTVILKTTDGGDHWASQAFPTDNIFINCILFRDSLNGWMGGSPNAIVKTTDGGITWTQAAIDTSTLAFFPVMRIRFYNEKYGYACGGIHDVAGVIWRTSNGGDKWYAIDPSQAPADEINELHLFDSLNVMGAGGDPDFGYGAGMIHTSDGGLSWQYQEIGMQGNAFDLDFRNDKEAWAPMGQRRVFIYSMDTGSSWKEMPTPDSVAIYDVTFPDSLHGFAVGQNGAVLKYKPPVIGSVRPDQSLNPDEYTLYQNYPNPFSSVTRIKFVIPPGRTALNSSIQITVYNVLRDEVASLINKSLSPGEYETTFDGSSLPEGIYYYQLGINSDLTKYLSFPKKMILIH